MANFRKSKAKNEDAWLRETIPSNTTRNTTKCAKNEGCCFNCNIDDVQDLNVEEMTPSTLHFWLTKFIGEVENFK